MKTRLLITLLILAVALLPEAGADEWISERFQCSLTIPTTESWTAGMRQSLPQGQMILHAIEMDSSRGIIVTVVPEVPSSSLRDPAMERRIQELLILQGWNLESGVEITWQDRPFLQFVGKKRDAVVGLQVGVSRVTIRAGTLYLVTAYGKGEANRVEDPKFMRVLNTFRFIDRRGPAMEAAEPASFRRYWIAFFGSAGAALLLVAAFAVTVRRSRHGTDFH